MKQNIHWLIVAFFILVPKLHASPVISVFLKRYPSSTIDKIQETGVGPKHLNNAHHKEQLWGTKGRSGIFATYAGLLQTSDLNGQIQFPRLHEKSRFNLIVTPRITPIIISGNTIAHWEIEEGTPALNYLIEQKKDPDTNILFWDVQATELPEQGIIPLESILIFAHPRHVYIPIGATITTQDPNLVLPDIYIKKGIHSDKQALFVLNISHFFGPINSLYKKGKSEYQQQVIY